MGDPSFQQTVAYQFIYVAVVIRVILLLSSFEQSSYFDLNSVYALIATSMIKQGRLGNLSCILSSSIH